MLASGRSVVRVGGAVGAVMLVGGGGEVANGDGDVDGGGGVASLIFVSSCSISSCASRCARRSACACLCFAFFSRRLLRVRLSISDCIVI